MISQHYLNNFIKLTHQKYSKLTKFIRILFHFYGYPKLKPSKKYELCMSKKQINVLFLNSKNNKELIKFIMLLLFLMFYSSSQPFMSLKISYKYWRRGLMMIRQKLKKTLTLNFIHLIFFYHEQAKYIQYIMLKVHQTDDFSNTTKFMLILKTYTTLLEK